MEGETQGEKTRGADKNPAEREGSKGQTKEGGGGRKEEDADSSQRLYDRYQQRTTRTRGGAESSIRRSK